MACSLVLGSFDMIHEGSEYETSVLAEGTSRGNPVPIEVAVKSWLQDGAIVVTQGYDNREVRVRVRFHGDDLTALAQAEAALFAELGKPNTLTWTPPDGAPASVFVVVTSSLEQEDDDLGEIDPDPYRTYSVRLVCEAFVRSTAEVVTEALGSGTMTVPPTPTSVTIDSGSSTTGWSGTYYRWDAPSGGTLTSTGATTNNVTSGSVVTFSPALVGADTFRSQIEAKRDTGTPIDVTDTKQIVYNWFWNASIGDPSLDDSWSVDDVRLLVNEATDNVYFERVGGAAAPTRLVAAQTIFRVPDSIDTIHSLRFIVLVSGAASNPGQVEAVAVDSIVRNNANTSVSTPRQLQRTIGVDGSARTPGRVTIAHEVSALGDVLAYFWPQIPQNCSPPLRQFRTDGSGVTSDDTLVSGAYENLVGDTTVFTIPAARVAPGAHLLMARLGGASTTATVTWSATTVLNGVNVGPTMTGTFVATLTTDYQNFTLGRPSLPTREVNPVSTTAEVQVTLTATVSSGSTANLDEAWLFNTSIGQLTQVACGDDAPASGGSSNRVFISPATTSVPRPRLRIGYEADESDAAYPLGAFWQPPQFTPPLVNVLTVTSKALDAAVTLSHFPRYHSHVA